MAVKTIIQIGDARLRTVADDVDMSDSSLMGLIKDLVDTLKAVNGVGLAAPQIGISKRVIVADLTGGVTPLVMINPVVLADLADMTPFEESCLSIPYCSRIIYRAEMISLQFHDPDGIRLENTYSGRLCKIIQHEIDHLNGRLIVDY